MKFASWLLTLTLWLLAACSIPANSDINGTDGVNALDQRDKPYLVLISIDGFRWDYQDLADTPALDRIAENGVRADALVPVFPSLTFPNHYSIATGLYPANHGLVGNRFPSKDRRSFYSLRDRETVQDGSWYSGEPVWVAAEKNGLVTAAFFFVGTEADVAGVRMSYWNAFDASISGKRRINQALDWLAMPDEQRPHLITLYFEHVDTATHRFGPGSKGSLSSIERVDAYIGSLLDGIDRLSIANDVYVVVVSDHGQADVVRDAKPFFIDTVADMDDITIVNHGSAAFLYLPEPDHARAEAICSAINESWTHGKAMLRDETPDSWHISSDSGFADIIVQADSGYSVYSSRDDLSHSGASLGDHGWAPEHKDMHGMFLASGPRLPEGKRIPAINAVDVYPLLMEILEIPMLVPIDGNPSTLTDLLAPR